jgi:sugar/nucleoside kinase (ribokinase family)
MTTQSLDVVGIGSAIVDVITQADDSFLEAHGMAKGGMQLIFTEEEAEQLYAEMGPGIEESGGSCANTMAGLASFGGAGAFVGVVRDDQLGEVFAHDMASIGVDYDVAPASEGPPTARCLIIVTSDAQRTLNTYLGAASGLGPDHVDPDLIARAQVVYLEGYLWDVQKAKDAMVVAMQAAAAADTRVSFTLSDGFCVDRHRAEFMELVNRHVDVLFANEDEITSLYEVDDFDAAVDQVRGSCEIACVTRSEKGSVIVTADERIEVAAEPVAQVVDTTGAGDQYAAGVLYGMTNGHDLATSGRLGSAAAAEVIGHYGARPATPLSALVATVLG